MPKFSTLEVAKFLEAGPGNCGTSALIDRAVVVYACNEHSTEAVNLSGTVFILLGAMTWAVPGDAWRSGFSQHFAGGRLDGDVVPAHAPRVGERHRHHEGGTYRVVAVGISVVTGCCHVAYRSEETGLAWSRHLADWSATLNLGTGRVVPRFVRIADEEPAEAPGPVQASPIRRGETRAIFRPDRDPELAKKWYYRTLRAGHEVVLLAEERVEGQPTLLVRTIHGMGRPPEYDVPSSLLEILPDPAPTDDDHDAIEVECETPAPTSAPVPWLPAAGSTWATVEGKHVTVRGTASVPGIGVVVLHDKLPAKAELRGLTHGATPLVEWHQAVEIGKRAVRRFVPVA